MGNVRSHLVEVLLTSSLGPHTFSLKVGANLDEGFLGDHNLLLPPVQLLLLREEPLLQLLDCHRGHHGRTMRGGPTYAKQ
jgi:hypothetical protein